MKNAAQLRCSRNLKLSPSKRPIHSTLCMELSYTRPSKPLQLEETDNPPSTRELLYHHPFSASNNIVRIV